MLTSLLSFTLLALPGGFAAAWVAARLRIARTNEHIQQLLQTTRDSVGRIQHAGELTAARERETLQALMREEYSNGQTELSEYETDIQQRESVLESREADLQESETELNGREQVLDSQKTAVAELRRKRSELRHGYLQALEERASMTNSEAVTFLSNESVSRASLDSQMRARQIESEAQENASTESRRIMTLAIDRYNGVGHLERIQNIIEIPDAQALMALGDPNGACHSTFVQEVGCELVLDEEARSLAVRGDNPLGREIARRILRQIALRPISNADKIRQLALQVKADVDKEVQNAGNKAVRLLELSKVHPDIINLVGRLKYRLSYSQNQWKHSVEVAYLAGIMAQEMKLDVIKARRGGLLHDIGKAMTHDHEGSHAVLGADVARRCGEEEIVANCIGSHHNDEPPGSALAHIVTAADAISGARPGARREAVTQYLTRIQDIQRIAGEDRAVQRVDIMQAGREVRVVVAGDCRGAIDPTEIPQGNAVADHELYPLAQDIARNLEEQITFAGQIRVTVIRESRCVAIAY